MVKKQLKFTFKNLKNRNYEKTQSLFVTKLFWTETSK